MSYISHLKEPSDGRLTIETDITYGWKGFVRVRHGVDAGSDHRLVTEATQEIDLRFFRLRRRRLHRTNRRTN